MGKVSLVICAICLLFMISAGIKSCSKTSDSNLQREKEKGYNVGVLEGKKAAESDYTKEMEKLKNDYEALLEKNKGILEGKVTESYNQGVQQGIEKMTEEINSAIWDIRNSRCQYSAAKAAICVLEYFVLFFPLREYKMLLTREYTGKKPRSSSVSDCSPIPTPPLNSNSFIHQQAVFVNEFIVDNQLLTFINH